MTRSYAPAVTPAVTHVVAVPVITSAVPTVVAVPVVTTAVPTPAVTTRGGKRRVAAN